MGALTLKSFPFELRGWDPKILTGIDPTSGFGSNIIVNVDKNRIIQIEPDHTLYSWINDKTRHFFDGLINWKAVDFKGNHHNNWSKILPRLFLHLYFCYTCAEKLFEKEFFTIVFENISLEVISLLNITAQNFSFVKLRKAENLKINNDLESNFQLNLISNKNQVDYSTISILISTNMRYQGYRLNLNIRQRYLRGNFKCILIGSLLDMTFPIYYIGSNMKTVNNMVTGTSMFCQELVSYRNPFIVINDELLKRHDELSYTVKVLTNSNFLNYTWYGFSILNSSLHTTGNLSFSNFLYFKSKDMIHFNSLYLINVNINQLTDLKRVVKLGLLNNVLNQNVKLNFKKIIIDQNIRLNTLLNHSYENVAHLPTSTFFENKGTYQSTEGNLKKTNKIIHTNKQIKGDWETVRDMFKSIKSKTQFFFKKDTQMVSFNCNNEINFSSFTAFNYNVTYNLTILNHYLSITNKCFYMLTKKFKLERKKIYDNKLKYWLDDFYIGGKDDYSQNSLVLVNCSNNIRAESTNFF